MQADKQMIESVARVVSDRYAEAIIHYWFSHDLGEITDLEFLTKKRELFQKAFETEVLCGRVGANAQGG
jgi:hypothetical protein